ncbi:hypothetical protein CM19_04045 [Candidatus Acidianus copahuensis]|uniref:CRISPR type III-associated protein domain-containing protein n=1 Tax=Candidatus Acidianus copahuensis TaxID=1160895 RepID=A0A031LQJ2_9CREN|nr:RAMP superfamily CRISPR-associated protein [Candidatus Acidianus copahuensis]EZQ10627.1 hypothetical protein CM19_04045 [Candidatus Acidianus copahuensis]
MIEIFKLKLSPKGNIRVAGEIDGNTIYPLNYDGLYVIPYSSLKGVLRRISESVVKTMNCQGNIKKSIETYIGTEGKYTHVVEKDGNAYIGNEVIRIDLHKPVYENLISCLSSRNNCEKVEEILHLFPKNEKDIELEEFSKIYEDYNLSKNNPLERIYGSPYFSGGLTISDARLEGTNEITTHVTIDRKTKIQKERNLFNEISLRSRGFNVFVSLKFDEGELGKCEKELWKMTLKYVNTLGIFVGGGKSRGLGYVILDDKESSYASINNLDERAKWENLNEYIS